MSHLPNKFAFWIHPEFICSWYTKQTSFSQLCFRTTASTKCSRVFFIVFLSQSWTQWRYTQRYFCSRVLYFLIFISLQSQLIYYGSHFTIQIMLSRLSHRGLRLSETIQLMRRRQKHCLRHYFGMNLPIRFPMMGMVLLSTSSLPQFSLAFLVFCIDRAGNHKDVTF